MEPIKTAVIAKHRAFCNIELPRIAFTLGLGLFIWTTPLLSADPDETVQDQLQRLSERHGFSLRGAEITAETPARETKGSLDNQIKQLLEGYGYLLVAPAETGPQRLVILGKQQPSLIPSPQPGIVLPTTRKGAHHLVDVMLRGPGGAEVEQQLMVDTGATYVALPKGSSEALGMDLQELEEKTIGTAKGKLQALVGKIPFLRIGTEEIDDVGVAFIDDNLLGETALLGMSVLGRYRVTLDDQKNTLTLREKESE